AEFYKKIANPNTRIFDVLKNDPYLKGILLGYGDANSAYFRRRCELAKYLRKYPFVRLLPQCEGLSFRKPNFPNKIQRPNIEQNPQLNSGFQSLEIEWQWMKEIKWDLEKEREAVPPYFIALPFYICRHGGDSELIREKYKYAAVKLANIFSGNSFQQAVAEEAKKR
ncbi:MAG TPA: hypothetical protein VN457_04335, partial [Chlamydiales bacterium]|nr:hypothetical protein [Chlamydiales bacterium]